MKSPSSDDENLKYYLIQFAKKKPAAYIFLMLIPGV